MGLEATILDTQYLIYCFGSIVLGTSANSYRFNWHLTAQFQPPGPAINNIIAQKICEKRFDVTSLRVANREKKFLSFIRPKLLKNAGKLCLRSGEKSRPFSLFDDAPRQGRREYEGEKEKERGDSSTKQKPDPGKKKEDVKKKGGKDTPHLWKKKLRCFSPTNSSKKRYMQTVRAKITGYFIV